MWCSALALQPMHALLCRACFPNGDTVRTASEAQREAARRPCMLLWKQVKALYTC